MSDHCLSSWEYYLGILLFGLLLFTFTYPLRAYWVLIFVGVFIGLVVICPNPNPMLWGLASLLLVFIILMLTKLYLV